MTDNNATSDGRANRSAETQARIIAVARDEFAEHGFGGASLAAIVRKADVTTGAIYHHFADKKGLFQAVAEHLEQEILDHVAALPPLDDPWEAFAQRIGGALEICARPDIARIVFKEAPSVIDPVTWREIEMQYAFGKVCMEIGALAQAGVIDAPNAELTSKILLGAIIEAAHMVASSEDKESALVEAQSAILKMVTALRNPAQG
ncbi:TetR/AcrR family transcriptional regulator [Alterisphingorhabdus coralli]|uniref:TetR/AcrR family transcriptional regulator n=1 Tax=Alterisphingorhabdus coralli TaxID=3071408 RepID=A0AA97F7U7_9SPHN|nr:TetR/AcrR family transcriptional regulator [Parasphingorhabdus sp. SCSIO 66989]WOE75776.1 TetR/AcrR family transcriptional regulator [Parasphingorhabdus sp. SCSIO 66989]